MNIKTEIFETKHKGYFKLSVNGVDLGMWEQSQLRQHIEDIDNAIHH